MRRGIFSSSSFAIAALCLAVSGCFAGYWARSDADTAVGDEPHVVNMPAQQAFVMTQDVLRGEGILFDTKPVNKIITDWKPGDTPASTFASLFGVEPRYRYEIDIVEDGPRRSKIIANVRT